MMTVHKIDRNTETTEKKQSRDDRMNNTKYETTESRKRKTATECTYETQRHRIKDID